MISWIQFTTSSYRVWSMTTFYIVVISVILTIGFTAVVFVGGLADLRYLLRSLGTADPDDQGQALTPGSNDEENAYTSTHRDS